MARRRKLAVTLTLVGLVPCGPAALAAYLLAANDAPAAFAPTATPAAASSDDVERRLPVSAGLLLTRGSVVVDWQNVPLTVDNGRYAYLGGETVTVAADSMGALRLDDGSVVLMCPGSSARVSVGAAGDVQLDLLSGTARFGFTGRTPFAVNAGPALVSAATVGEPVVGEIAAGAMGATACALQGDFAIGTGTGSTTRAVAGDMLTVSTREDGGGDVTARPLPPALATAVAAGSDLMAGDAAQICRCRVEERVAEADDAGEQVPADVSAVPEGIPPVLPPPPATPALATPEAPDPFDPNALPPPAAGPGDQAPPTLVVPSPAVPSGGTGGGGTTSPA